jgi:hypothetical protein
MSFNRRVSPLGGCFGEGRFTQPTAGAQLARPEPPFMPHICHSRFPPGSDQLDGKRSFASTHRGGVAPKNCADNGHSRATIQPTSSFGSGFVMRSIRARMSCTMPRRGRRCWIGWRVTSSPHYSRCSPTSTCLAWTGWDYLTRSNSSDPTLPVMMVTAYGEAEWAR